MPTSLIELAIAVWIMSPRYSGEEVLFNIFSDKLEDKFEYNVMVIRNIIAN
jgi:hypothetical protein